MSNNAVNIMINSLPKNYFKEGLTQQEKRKIARNAFYPTPSDIKYKKSWAELMEGLNNNSNNNSPISKASNNSTRKLKKNAKNANNAKLNANRIATRNARYGPKFRQPRIINTSYKAPPGSYNIFPKFSNSKGSNNKSTIYNSSNNYTGINNTVPNNIKTRPVSNNIFPVTREIFYPRNKFGPHYRKSRKLRR